MRTGKRQTGVFDVKPGMAFIMHDMKNLLPDIPEKNPGNHPWLITTVDNDYVEMVMCSTLSSESEGKNRMRSLMYDDTTDIPDACPPMDSNRISRVQLETFMAFPKKELFSHKLSLLNDNTPERNFEKEGMDSLCMSDRGLQCVCGEINEYIASHSGYDYDPFKCILYSDYMYNLEEGFDTPKWFTKESYDRRFGWESIQSARENAAYPSENSLHPYEKFDQRLIRAIRSRDSSSHRQDSPVASTARNVPSVPESDGGMQM